MAIASHQVRKRNVSAFSQTKYINNPGYLHVTYVTLKFGVRTRSVGMYGMMFHSMYRKYRCRSCILGRSITRLICVIPPGQQSKKLGIGSYYSHPRSRFLVHVLALLDKAANPSYNGAK